MKLKTLSLASLAASAMVGAASAATTISYSYQTITSSTDMSWVSPTGATSVVAFNMGSSTASTSFGSVNWLTTYAPAAGNSDNSITMNFHIPSVAWAQNYDGFYTGTTANSILATGNYRGETTCQLDLNGFTVGQEYLVQFVVADDRNEWWGPVGRTVTIDGFSANIASQDASAYQYAYGNGSYAVVTARFTPDAGDTNFSFRPLVNGGDLGVQVNAVQVLTIPEPSATLLGGLGMLALLRRRRA